MAVFSESFHFPKIETLYIDELLKMLDNRELMVIPGGSPIDSKYKVFKSETDSILAYTDITGRNEPVENGTALRVFNKHDPSNPLYYHFSKEHSGMKRRRTKRRRQTKRTKRRQRTKRTKKHN